MAVPKKKVSPGRRNMRRFSTAYKLEPVTVSTCKECQSPVRPHTVCKCGAYGEEKLFTPRIRTKPEAEATPQK